jgi:CMP/dCMP kinase
MSCAVATIDGPSGSGKGTISRAVARYVRWHLLDSGALYRLVALAGLKGRLEPDDISGHMRLAESMQISFGAQPDGTELVTLEGQDVTRELRSQIASQGASHVAAWPQVRTALLGRQRAFCRPPGLIADGRDMGTVVFPEADLKIYLTATLAERAQRRYKQLKDKGSGVSLAALSREIAERDLRDSTRKVSPLKAAPDAHVIDSTELTIDEVVNRVLELGRKRSLWG